MPSLLSANGEIRCSSAVVFCQRYIGFFCTEGDEISFGKWKYLLLYDSFDLFYILLRKIFEYYACFFCITFFSKHDFNVIICVIELLYELNTKSAKNVFNTFRALRCFKPVFPYLTWKFRVIWSKSGKTSFWYMFLSKVQIMATPIERRLFIRLNFA